ncbi:MAG: hypothetical protein KDA99_18310, partial [Planctomycetales bacterium]|nr:hypothetical protein [Planctomycetales bacterium]
MRAPEFVFVGNPTASEFRDAVTWLRHNGHTLWLHDLQQLQNSAEHWRAPPTIIILAQEYTQQFSTATIENVRRRWPLSRWVMLLGPWCDGENRSGQPAYGMQRLMWHSFAPIMQQNWRLARTGGLPHWAIPEPG